MPNFSLGAWIFLTATIMAVIGVCGWMVADGYLTGTVLFSALSVILTAIVGVVFHNAGATAALATPAAPTPAPGTVTVTPTVPPPV